MCFDRNVELLHLFIIPFPCCCSQPWVTAVLELVINFLVSGAVLRQPVQVRMDAKDLKTEFEAAINNSRCVFSGKGSVGWDNHLHLFRYDWGEHPSCVYNYSRTSSRHLFIVTLHGQPFVSQSLWAYVPLGPTSFQLLSHCLEFKLITPIYYTGLPMVKEVIPVRHYIQVLKQTISEAVVKWPRKSSIIHLCKPYW